LASEATLKRLKREPQFIDAIFTAKTERTKMEEMPTMSVPDTETEQEFVIHQQEEQDVLEILDVPEAPEDVATDNDEFDLSDITATPREQSREEIIAAAEAAAFEEDKA
jgi:ribonuclease-3